MSFLLYFTCFWFIVFFCHGNWNLIFAKLTKKKFQLTIQLLEVKLLENVTVTSKPIQEQANPSLGIPLLEVTYVICIIRNISELFAYSIFNSSQPNSFKYYCTQRRSIKAIDLVLLLAEIPTWWRFRKILLKNL